MSVYKSVCLCLCVWLYLSVSVSVSVSVPVFALVLVVVCVCACVCACACTCACACVCLCLCAWMCKNARIKSRLCNSPKLFIPLQHCWTFCQEFRHTNSTDFSLCITRNLRGESEYYNELSVLGSSPALTSILSS